MTFHNLVRPAAAGLCLVLAATACGQGKTLAPLLSAKEVADGWVMLFDEESAFGWTDGTVAAGSGN